MIWPFSSWDRQIEIATLDILAEGWELSSATLWSRIAARVTACRFGYMPHHVFRSLEAAGMVSRRSGYDADASKYRIYYRLAGTEA